MSIQTGQTINFTSQYIRGNGSWKVMKIWNDGQVWLARLGKKGQLLTPNTDNQMNVTMATISEAVTVGTAKVI